METYQKWIANENIAVAESTEQGRPFNLSVKPAIVCKEDSVSIVDMHLCRECYHNPAQKTVN